MSEYKKGALGFLAFIGIILAWAYLFDSRTQSADIRDVELIENLVILSVKYGDSLSSPKAKTERFAVERENYTDARKTALEIRKLIPAARADNYWNINVNRMGNGVIDMNGAYYWEISRAD